MLASIELNLQVADNECDSVCLGKAIEQVRLAERYGYEGIYVLEHHGTDYSISSSPLQFLTYLAALTERLRLGVMTVIPRFHYPDVIAEQIAMLDILSGGRTRVAFGRGHKNAKPPASPECHNRSSDRSASQFIADVEAVSHLLRNSKYAKQANTRPKEFVFPRPEHAPEHEFHIATSDKEVLSTLLPRGYGIVTKDLDGIRDVLADCRPGTSPRIIYEATIVLGASHHEATEKALCRYASDKARTCRYHAETDFDHHIAGRTDLNQEGRPSIPANGLVGTPGAILEQLRELNRVQQIDELLLEFDFGGVANREVHSDMETASRQILPVLISDPSFASARRPS